MDNLTHAPQVGIKGYPVHDLYINKPTRQFKSQVFTHAGLDAERDVCMHTHIQARVHALTKTRTRAYTHGIAYSCEAMKLAFWLPPLRI